jgi:VanZ family protein
MNNPVDRKSGKATTSLVYGFVLLLVVLFIIYGSLFPFDFRERSYPGGPVLYLLSTWHEWDNRGDLLANILLYLPFGFFMASALPPRFSGALGFVLATIAGVAFSSAIEITQFHDLGRVTSMGDVYANGIGAACGAAARILLGTSLRWPLIGELAANPTAALLLTMFFAYRLYPYVPVIDLHKYWHAVRPMLMAPSLPSGEFSRYLVTWLFVAAIVHVLYGSRRFLLLFPLLCGAEFLGRVLIIDNTLKLDDVLSAAGAWLLWSVLLSRLPGRFSILAFAFATMITMERLEPFQFEALPRAFGWIPFASFMHGSTGVDIQAFCQKFYEYGGLIWLLNRAGMRLILSTVSTATLLFTTSLAECWVPGRSAEITDAIMALVLGIVFAVLREREPMVARLRGPSRGEAARMITTGEDCRQDQL